MNFFTSSADLMKWVQSQESSDSAAKRIIGVVGSEKQQDILEICRAIIEEKDSLSAAKVLYQILAKYNLIETREGNMQNKIVKEAQIMRQPGEYDMPLRVCPKLPYSVGKRLISTYNCRHYCLDSIVLDDDPDRVYCAESMWRRHVMDKFSREFKDKDGKWVGGYINERFQVNHDFSGNQMGLSHGERTRLPRPHQYSTERRLEEARGEKTSDLTASSNKIVKLASIDKLEEKDNVYQMFSDMIEMRASGLGDEDIISKVSEHYNEKIPVVAQVYKLALAQLNRYDKVVYSYNNSSLKKTAYGEYPDRSTIVSKRDVEIITVSNNQKTVLKMETPVVIVSSKDESPTLQIVDGPDAGTQFKLSNASDLKDAFVSIEDTTDGTIQEAADEVGLNEDNSPVEATDDFPIIEK